MVREGTTSLASNRERRWPVTLAIQSVALHNRVLRDSLEGLLRVRV